MEEDYWEELDGEEVEEDEIVKEEVHDTLFRHRDNWDKFGAGAFMKNVIEIPAPSTNKPIIGLGVKCKFQIICYYF